MNLSRQRKITAALLIIYWPSLFFAAHTPVPQVVQEADVSDKGLHLLAYLILVFLLWFTVSDGRKTNWRKAAPWCVLCIIIVYSIFDEWTQSFVPGRNCDPRDLLADLTGTSIGLAAFSFLSVWPAGLLVTAIVILLGANIAGADLSDLMPAANAAFHLISYAVLTALWLGCVDLFMPAIDPLRTKGKWLLTALAAPAAMLLITKLFSMIFSREWTAVEVVFSAGAALAVIALFYLFAMYGSKSQEVDKGDGPA